MSLDRAILYFDKLLEICGLHLSPANTNLGKYESDSAAFSLTRLAFRHAQGVCELAKSDLDNYAPAATISRTTFETGATAAWLMVPDDPFEREGRWLGYYRSHERFYENLAKDLVRIGSSNSEVMWQAAHHYRDWRAAIEQVMPRHVKHVLKPTMPEILKELGYSNLYLAYRSTSQVVHAEPDALDLVRQIDYIKDNPNDTSPIFKSSEQVTRWGSFIDDKLWVVLLRMNAWGLIISLTSVLDRIKLSWNPQAIYDAETLLFSELNQLETRPKPKSH
jgi:hypothetical protein